LHNGFLAFVLRVAYFKSFFTVLIADLASFRPFLGENGSQRMAKK
jgi:hypothetical protein